MLQAPDQRKFVLIGFLEATAQVISMICVSQLPGLLTPTTHRPCLRRFLAAISTDLDMAVIHNIQVHQYDRFYFAHWSPKRRIGYFIRHLQPGMRPEPVQTKLSLHNLLAHPSVAGVVLPLLNQTILLWQVALGSLFQGQRYSHVQLFGIILVVSGVAKAAWPSSAGGSILGQVQAPPSEAPRGGRGGDEGGWYYYSCQAVGNTE